MTKATVSTILAIACMSIVLVGCGKKEDGRVLKLAHGLPVEHPVHKAMVFMAERVAEKSQGAMRIDIYPSEQLGSETKCLQQLQNGELAMTKTSSSPLESFVDEMKVLGLPYIFRDNDHYWKVLLGDVGKELLAAGTSNGLKGLCYYDAGARSFYTVKTPVSRPEDLAGLKIRVQKSPVAMDMVKAMGASGTPIDWGELYTALQQGVVDGAENNAPSLYTSKHYEICKYYALDEHTMPPDVLLISPVIWKRLTPEEQTILQEAADESVTHQRKLWAEFEQESMEEIRKAGVDIRKVDKAPFRAKVQGMLKAYDGTPIGDMIKRIDEVQ